MNKLLRYSFVALLAMIGLNISAQEVTLDFTLETSEGSKESVWGFPASSKNKTVEEKSFTYGGYTIKVAGSEGEGYYWHDKDHYLLFGKQGAYIVLPAFDFDVERIDIEGNSSASANTKQNIFVGDEAVSDETTGAQGTNYFTIADGKQAAGTIYVIKVTSKHNNQIKTIKIWKKGSGTKQAADITWSKSSATVTIGANDNVFPTLNNPNGLTVSYASSKEDVATVNENGQVTLVAAGSTKISAIFEGNDSYEASTVSYTLTVKEAEIPSQETTVANVAALNALQNGDAFTYTSDVLVVYLNGKYAYIKDDTGSSLIFDNGTTKLANLAIGKKVAANWNGKVSVYNNLFEAVPDAVLAVTSDAAVEVTYPEAAITDVVAANMNQIVVLKGVAYTALNGKNFTISKGGVDVKGYNQFGLEIAAPEESKSYDITGVISVYKNDVQFQPIAIEEAAAEPQPEIEKQNLTFETQDYCAAKWNAETNTFTWGSGGWNSAWTFMAAVGVSGDLSSWETLHFKATNFVNSKEEKLTVVFKKNDGSNPPSGPTKEFVVSPDANGDITIDLTKVEWGDCDITNIQDLTIYGGERVDDSVDGSVVITDAYLAKAKSSPSSINTINAAKADNGAIYSIAGQKVNAGYKGLVIKNGKKFVNK